MSLWIQVDAERARNRKTYLLAELLAAGCADLFGGRDEVAWRAIAIALLDAFWGYVAEHFPDGDVTKAHVGSLREELLVWLHGTDWAHKDVRELLLKSGHLDRKPNGRIVVHDWFEWTGGSVLKLAKDRKRKRLKRSEEARRSPRTRAGTGRRRSATSPVLTMQDYPVLDHPIQDVKPAPAAAPRPVEAEAPQQRLKYVLACTMACNEGLHANPAIGDRCNELFASSQTAPLDWYADGIDVAVAAAAIRATAVVYKPKPRNPQPRDLRYFDGAVRDAWERARQKASVPSTTTQPNYSGSAFREAKI